MGLYNAVLLPDVDFRDRIVDYAQDKYDKISDGYCLSYKVYPHITLCQFEADDQPMIFIDDLFEPVFTLPNIRQGQGDHLGYNWVEWLVQKDEWLIQLQESVRSALKDEGAKISMGSAESYHPHMTFCRTAKQELADIPLAMVEQSDKPWIFTIGESDQNGQFLG